MLLKRFLRREPHYLNRKNCVLLIQGTAYTTFKLETRDKMINAVGICDITFSSLKKHRCMFKTNVTSLWVIIVHFNKVSDFYSLLLWKYSSLFCQTDCVFTLNGRVWFIINQLMQLPVRKAAVFVSLQKWFTLDTCDTCHFKTYISIAEVAEVA